MPGMREYQAWVREFDEARGWDCILATDTFVHLVEEVGEVGRCLLVLAGYKGSPEPPEETRRQLAEELADAITFLVKIGYTCGIDVAAALEDNMAKCAGRYDTPAGIRAGIEESDRYLKHRRESLDALVAAFRRRFPEGAPR